MATKTKSKVNAAGNYTKPELRKRLFNQIKASMCKVLLLVSGWHVRRSCWRRSIKPLAGGTEIENSTEIAERLDGTKVAHEKR